MITPVILCGGVGSRLWPLSRVSYPKQFLRIDGDLSLFQKTCQRVSDRRKFSAPIVICNEEYRFRVAEHLNQIGINDAHIILEPKAKNTAPAIAVAALFQKSKELDHPMIILPSDHVIADRNNFLASVDKAKELANKNYLVTFGIEPSRPATGFGYIEPGKKLGGGNLVKSFIEKPDLKNAKKFVKDGYCWNSGMFVFRPSVYLEDLEEHHKK